LILCLLAGTVRGQPCTGGGQLPVIKPATATMALPNSNTDPSGLLNGAVVQGPASIQVTSNGQRDAITVMVGALVNVTIDAEWTGSEHGLENITLFTYEEPGIPNGGVMSHLTCMGEGMRCNPVRRTFAWTPAPTQHGRVHTMCFVAHPVTPALAACPSAYRCVDITVHAPTLQWVGATPQHDLLVHSAVGCTLTVCPEVEDTSRVYNVDVNPVPGTMPPGAQFDVACEARPQSGSLHPLWPALAYPMRSTTGCKRCMHWEAVRGLETQNFTACFTGTDRDGLESIRTCLRIYVPKCKYCVQEGDTLHSINKKYRLNSNWLQLWNSNGIGEIGGHPLSPATAFPDPDGISNGHSVINLGPSYEMKQGESLNALAASFRTTIRKLLDVNPDIVDSADVHEGTLLCVMPCTDGLV